MVQISIILKWLVLQTVINSYHSTAAIGVICGQTIKKFHETIDFKSPQFPQYLSEDSLCEVSIKLDEKYKFVRIDFVNVTMDGQGLFGDVDSPGLCESDMFFFKGFDSWTPPPKCGDLNGYSYLFDKRSTELKKRTFKIVALMSSEKYRWHIRITQVIKEEEDDEKDKASRRDEKDKPSRRDEKDRPSRRDEKDNPSRSHRRDEKDKPSRRNEKDNPSRSHRRDEKDNPSRSHRRDEKDKPSRRNEKDNLSRSHRRDEKDKPSRRNEKDKPSRSHRRHRNLQLDKLHSGSRTPSVKFIQNGTSVSNATVPWLVSIRTKAIGNRVIKNCPDVDTEGVHFCGGSIIGPDIILSAAHCFHGRSKYASFPKLESLKVVVGETNVCKDNSRDPILPTFDYDIQSIVFYYGYDPQLKYHDIAVVKLKSNIIFMNHIHPIKMEKSTILNFYTRQISGFGAWNQRDKGYSIQSNSLTSAPEYFPYNPQVSFSTLTFSSLCAVNKIMQLFRNEFFSDELLENDKYRNALGDTLCVGELEANVKHGEEGKPAHGDSGGPVANIRQGKDPLLSGILIKVKKTFLDKDAKHIVMLDVSKKRRWVQSVIQSFRLV